MHSPPSEAVLLHRSTPFRSYHRLSPIEIHKLYDTPTPAPSPPPNNTPPPLLLLLLLLFNSTQNLTNFVIDVHLQQLATATNNKLSKSSSSSDGFLGVSQPEDLQPTVKICVDSLTSSYVVVKRSTVAKLRLLAKNRSENRALIGESGAVLTLISLLRCADP
ncbi:hypothetical protein L6452_40307 [Arctium lappa]|uniref:Uncharacterized protein n=1 Tax=Arctium lappa TaxID=4217 RepID=A0ACB8XMR5_ARCLA|nr:hypothetical protein L6452_40307 [Arctium lappa]